MKKLHYLLIFILFTTLAHAKIWRVNNNPGVVADFTTLQDAHDGAVAGDTLLIHPSINNYGSLTCIKRLVIMGAGYFLKENYPDYPMNQTNATTTISVTLESGSSGTIIQSIDEGGVLIKASNILINRTDNLYIQILEPNLSNITISQNYNCRFNFGANTITGLVIKNNYIGAWTSVSLSSTFQATFINNIFAFAGWIFGNQILVNNIAITGGSFTFNNTTLTNNIDAAGSSARFGTINGNFGNVSTNSIFLDASGNSTDGRWRLRPGSPAIGAGIDGVDCGMYGGPEPYIRSGVPPIPLFTKFVTTGVGSNTTPLQVTVSMQSNN